MAFAILVSFEPFQDVKALRVPIFGREFRRMLRAYAGTAKEEEWNIFHCSRSLQLFQESRIGYASRIEAPLHRSMLIFLNRNPAYPISFRNGADIDQFNCRVGLQERVRFLWRNGASVSKMITLAALAGYRKDIGSHRELSCRKHPRLYIEGYRRMAGQMLRHVDALALEVISACTGAVR